MGSKSVARRSIARAKLKVWNQGWGTWCSLTGRQGPSCPLAQDRRVGPQTPGLSLDGIPGTLCWDPSKLLNRGKSGERKRKRTKFQTSLQTKLPRSQKKRLKDQQSGNELTPNEIKIKEKSESKFWISMFREGGRRRLRHPTPVLLPGKPHGRSSLVGCRPWGR